MRVPAQLQAGITARYRISGNFFYLETLPGGQVSVQFFRDQQRLEEEIESTSDKGWSIDFRERFNLVEITSTLNQVVVFHVARGRLGVNVFSGNVSVNKPTTIDTLADVALAAGVATQILPADAARRQALITNLQANANIIRVGDVNVGAARGVQVAPGQTITLDGTEAIFGFDAALESVGVLVIKD